MSPKVLFCATVDYHFKAFHIPYLKWFKELGWDVHVAANGELELPYLDQKYNIPFQRSPLSKANISAYKKLKKIIDEQKYDLIHCHTPVGGIIARLAARAARMQGSKVLYTAHGFHFCKGAPLKNWLLYYPIEKMMARWTDCLITINQEDYERSKKKFKVNRIEFVHGVGVNTMEYRPLNDGQKNELKESFGYSPDDFLLFYAAEFNQNKNQQFLLNSFANLYADFPKIKLILAGEGRLLEQCRELAEKLGISDRVHFLGFRKDIKQLIQICDVAVASSYREGLPVNVMEAMACGLPVVATDNRGHRELIQNNKNGWVIKCDDQEAFNNKVKLLFSNEEIKRKLGHNGRQAIIDTYSIQQVLAHKTLIYQSFQSEMEDKKWVVH